MFKACVSHRYLPHLWWSVTWPFSLTLENRCFRSDNHFLSRWERKKCYFHPPDYRRGCWNSGDEDPSVLNGACLSCSPVIFTITWTMKAIEPLSAENGIFPKSAVSILDVSFCFFSHESFGFQQKPEFNASSDWVLCPHEAHRHASQRPTPAGSDKHIPTGSGWGLESDVSHILRTCLANVHKTLK